MQTRSAEIAIVGAGPAGAHLASRLAAEGREVVLFDPKGAWEKPCGGGVPTRAIREFAFILEDSNYPRKLVRKITMISPLNRRVTLNLEEPFAIYSRQVLNGLVLDRAIEAGAEFVREGVRDFHNTADGWSISTDCGSEWRVRLLVGADGAASFTRRRLVGIFPKRDLALAFGYNVVCAEADGTRGSDGTNMAQGSEPFTDEIVVRFPRDFTGYLWAFPRPGVMNFGVFSRFENTKSQALRKLLTDFVCTSYGGCMPDPKRVSFFAAKIPALDPGSWKGLQASGDRWALVGDGAGFADPITGEGIYYALKSADLLANGLHRRRETKRRTLNGKSQCMQSDYGLATAHYEQMWRDEFGRELEHASYRRQQFYHGRFLGRTVTDAMVMLARHHRGVRAMLAGVLTGAEGYLFLRTHLLRRVLQVF
ncbi:MAG: NAD(P)/FAD-dependent oxidoreductase, partial [Blastocatellia bacterium]